MPPSITWPEGKTFAFTVFDDPDGDTVEARRFVYPFLQDLGFRTTRGVWPTGPVRDANSDGETCAALEFLAHAIEIQQAGFEIGYHNAAPHSSTRAEVDESLELFRKLFGSYPSAMANHYNADAMYWGTARLSGALTRTLYNAMTLGRNGPRRFQGQVESSSHFWGDLCRERIRYCRNFVFSEINTIKACPWMPYYDPDRPYVKNWYSSAEGPVCASFVKTLHEANQDRLEAEGGLCIMYTHFGKGFVEDKQLSAEFSRLMKRLSRKNGWFVPVSTVLDHLRRQKGEHQITPGERATLERKWLAGKVFKGTT